MAPLRVLMVKRCLAGDVRMAKKMVASAGLAFALMVAGFIMFTKPVRAEPGMGVNLLSTESFCMTAAACDGLKKGESCDMCQLWADKRGTLGTSKGAWQSKGLPTCGQVWSSKCVFIDPNDESKGIMCDAANLKQPMVIVNCPQKASLVEKQAPQE